MNVTELQNAFNLNYFLMFLVFIGGVSFLFPIVSAITYFFTFQWVHKKNLYVQKNLSLDVLIPAYHEKDTLEQTVSSVLKARDALLKENILDAVNIIISLDGADEDTRNIALKLSSHACITLNDRKNNLGKWKTLFEMVQISKADWCAIVDSGTVWGENFLIKLRNYILHCKEVGFAPGYIQKKSSLIERVVWWQERVLKKIENLSGGPVSVHGASMIFRSDVLKSSFERLNYRTWLNDDVVIALMARTSGSIRYLGKSLYVTDCGNRESVPEFNRRKRMVAGNIEWMRELWAPLVHDRPLVAMVALRRVARVFWFYFILGSVLFLVASITGRFYLGLFSSASLIGLLRFHPRLWEAGYASLLAPFLLKKTETKVDWV